MKYRWQLPDTCSTRKPLANFVLLFAICLGLVMLSQNANAASERQIIDGFNKTVFGAEYSPFGVQSTYIRKYRGTVRVYIHNRSAKNRKNTIKSFISGLNRKIAGLKIRVVSSKSSANFNVYIVDRKDYVTTVRKSIYRNSSARAPGKCLVRSVFSPNGIVRSDAIIVSDEGENLFQRCMAEEILQGLGPLNEHSSLRESMFNDRSKHTKFTKFDRYILNMLYDPRIKTGSSRKSVQSLLPQVLKDAKRRF